MFREDFDPAIAPGSTRFDAVGRQLHSSDVEHDVGERERLGVGRIARVRDRDDAHPGGVRGADAGVRVLDRGAALGRDAEPARGLEVDVGSRLAARHLLRRDGRLERIGDAGEAQHLLEDRAVRRRRERERELRREAPDDVDSAGQERQLACVRRRASDRRRPR